MAATGIEDIGPAGGGDAGGAVLGMGPAAAAGLGGGGAEARGAGVGGAAAAGASAALGASLAGASDTSPASILQTCIPGVTVEPSSTSSSLITPEQGEFTGMEVCNTSKNMHFIMQISN